MIHVENITINIHQPYNTETGPANDVSDALMKAMAESLFAEQTEEELDSEGEVQPPTNPPRMNSLQQQSVACWHAVCGVLHEVCPDWCNGTGSATDQAVSAIRAMAKAR